MATKCRNWSYHRTLNRSAAQLLCALGKLHYRSQYNSKCLTYPYVMSSDECASIHQITPARPRHKAITRVCVISDDPQKDESPSEFDNDDGKESLYEDRFCKVTATDIFVKCYYFPCGSQARIPLQEIKSLRIQAQAEERPSIAWGSVDDVVWWALDSKRRLRAKHWDVVIRETRRPYLVGFTVRDRMNFENVLRRLQSIRFS